MKKSLLLAAGFAAMALSASAANYVLVGAYNSWSLETATVMTGEGDVLSCKIDKLINDFKIVDTDVPEWGNQFSTSTPIEIGVPVTLTARGGKENPDLSNMAFAGLIQYVNNATVTFNPTTLEMTVSAAESDVVIDYPELYVTGSFTPGDGWAAPGSAETPKCTRDGNIYTAKVNLGDSGNVEFKLAGSGWSNEIAGGVTVTADEAVTVKKGGDNLKTNLTGEQTLTFNISTWLMTFGDPELTMVGEGTSVEAIETVDAPVEYFNLQGVKVANPDKGIYIVRQGSKVVKSVIR